MISKHPNFLKENVSRHLILFVIFSYALAPAVNSFFDPMPSSR